MDTPDACFIRTSRISRRKEVGNVLRTDYYHQCVEVNRDLRRVNRELAMAISDRVALDRAVTDAVPGSDDQIAARQRRQWNEETQCSLATEQLPLMNRREHLRIAEADGLVFKRTEGFAFVNQSLPRIPEGAREVSVAMLLRKPPSRNVRFGGAAAGVTLVAMVLGALTLLPLWVTGDVLYFVARLTGDHSETLVAHRPDGFTLILGGVVAGGLVLSALFSTVLGTVSLLEKQHRYFLGAGGWSWKERLTACCGYAIGSWWIMVCPLVVILVRFCLALVSTQLQIRAYDEKRLESVTEGVRVSTQFTRSFTRQVMLVGGLTFLVVMFW